MSTDVSDLLRNAANIFSQLAEAYEQDKRSNDNRLANIEVKTYENRKALKTAAELILDKLN